MTQTIRTSFGDNTFGIYADHGRVKTLSYTVSIEKLELSDILNEISNSDLANGDDDAEANRAAVAHYLHILSYFKKGYAYRVRDEHYNTTYYTSTYKEARGRINDFNC